MKNKYIYIIFCLIFSINLFSQKDTNTYKEITLITTSPNDIKVIHRYPNEKKEWHYIYENKYSLREIRVFENNICVGLVKYKQPCCDLEYKIDIQTGEYIDYRISKGKFYEIKNQAKKNADSILTLFFNTKFIKNNIRCNYYNCYYYDKDYLYYNWFEQCDVLPKEFHFEYYIILDSIHKYNSIKFDIDLNGNLLKVQHPQGLENCKKFSKFVLTSNEIIEIAKKEKFPVKDTNFTYFLKWIPNVQEYYIGEYEVLCLYLIKTKRYKNNKKFFIEETYNILILNPWTGEIKNKEKIKRTGEIKQSIIWLDNFY